MINVIEWIKNLNINPHTYEHLILDKDIEKLCHEKKLIIFNNWGWHNCISTCRRLQIDPYLSPCTKLKSKCIKGLSINLITTNLIEEKVGSNFKCLGMGELFLNITSGAQILTTRINKCDLLKLRSIYNQRTHLKRQKESLMNEIKTKMLTNGIESKTRILTHKPVNTDFWQGS